MLSVKVYSPEAFPMEGGGYTYLNSYLKFFKQQAGGEVCFHKHYSCSSRFQQLIFALNRVFGDLKFDWIIFKNNYIPGLSFNIRSVLIVDFPFKQNLSYFERIKLSRIRHIICNSEYTATYIQKYWNRKALVLYPPCMDFSATPVNVKKKYILNVGRFVSSARSKRQDVLIEAFIQLYSSGTLDDYTLILAGFVQNEAYLGELKAMCIGYPIVFHENADTPLLRTLYNESTIYWHACGYEVNIEQNPAHAEHYGIAVADAMAAGCVTIVHNSGGPAELVHAPDYGLVWETVDELADLTAGITADSLLIQRYATKAKSMSKKFSEEEFILKLERLFKSEANN